MDGTIECGPNAVFTFKREDYLKNEFSFVDAFDALSFKGTWKLFLKNWKFGLDEYKRAFSKKIFLKEINKLEGCFFSRMTGSGSACYGLFDDENSSKVALKRLRKKYPKFWFSIAKTI